MPKNVVLSDPLIKWNDQKFYIKGNTTKMTNGGGEGKLTPTSAGGGDIEMVMSEDVTTYKSMVKFDLMATPENIKLVAQMQADRRKGNLSTLEIIGATDSYQFEQCIITKDIDWGLESEGSGSLEVEGAPRF